jgi:hypothetical protein
MRFLAIHPKRFKTMFRMHRTAFDKLVDLLDGALRRPTRRGLGGALEPWLMVAVGLRWLAGGSHHDIGFGSIENDDKKIDKKIGSKIGFQYPP